MLRFAEELMLLILDDENGRFARVPDRLMRYALAGGVLMDLALENRIDTDLKNLILVDSTPVQDSLLDPTLADIAQATDTKDARFWVERTALRADEIREEALNRLVEQGILQREEDRFLWVFQSRRYPIVDNTAEREVKLRIMEVLFSDQIPDPRDVVIIGLAHACDIFTEILSARELARVADRIDQVRKLDLIGQAMSQAITDIELSLALAVQMMP
jgi:Golgi phosphoprotein 3